MSTVVHLTWSEVRVAALTGVDRNCYGIHHGLNPARPLPGWDAHVVGALGELAVAKLLGRYAAREHTDRATGDVAGLQVRATWLDAGRLILRTRDVDEAWYVLVRGMPPDLEVVGAITGGAGKRPEWWKAPNGRAGAWFIPDEALAPLEVDR